MDTAKVPVRPLNSPSNPNRPENIKKIEKKRHLKSSVISLQIQIEKKFQLIPIFIISLNLITYYSGISNLFGVTYVHPT